MSDPRQVSATPTIHCVRHGQAYHNLSIANHGMHDPLLTPYGEEQCRRLQTNFPSIHNIELVVSSPLKRTLYTSLIAFEQVMEEHHTKIIALPELQETSDMPCDTGSPLEDVQREFADKPVDLSLVPLGWDNKRFRWAPTVSAIGKRAKDAREWLMLRPESEIVVVTHGGLLQYLTFDRPAAALDPASIHSSGWGNAEWRTYTFSSSDPGSAYLVETPQSKQRRLGAAKPLNANEKTQLERTVANEVVKV